MAQDRSHWTRIINIGGAFIAFLIGSGFATGQEVLQYFTSYGYRGVLGACLVLVLLLYVGISFITAGHRHRFEKGADIFSYYCGKTLGRFFDYFSILFIYLSFSVMVAGAGATFNQHFGQPVIVGATVMVITAAVTVLFGLNNIVAVIGKIGPVIVVCAVVLGIVAIAQNPGSISAGNDLLPTLKLTKASTNWFFAAGSYVGFCMLWLAGFLAAIGSTSGSEKEAVFGAALGAVGFSIGVIIFTLALLARIEDVAGSLIPSLYLAAGIHPVLATLFSIMIIAGIYSTSVPLLWSVSARFTVDRSREFRILTIILALGAFVIGIWLPFDRLVNIVYVINGYVGILLLVMMLLKSVRDRLFSKTEPREGVSVQRELPIK